MLNNIQFYKKAEGRWWKVDQGDEDWNKEICGFKLGAVHK